jgi:hypothetical protein
MTMKNAIFWGIKPQFVLHRRHITSPLQSPASYCYARFEVFTAVTMKDAVSKLFAACNLLLGNSESGLHKYLLRIFSLPPSYVNRSRCGWLLLIQEHKRFISRSRSRVFKLIISYEPVQAASAVRATNISYSLHGAGCLTAQHVPFGALPLPFIAPPTIILLFRVTQSSHCQS